MSLRTKTSELKRRMQEAFKGGGEQATEKQKASGKLTARERIIALLDPDTFHEYDLFVLHAGVDFDMDKKYLPGDGVITGTGSITGWESPCVRRSSGREGLRYLSHPVICHIA